MKEKLRRMSIIVYMLKIKAHSIEQITSRINHITGMNYHRSSIEKDIQMLRNDFGCPIERNNQNRLVILEEYSYTEMIIQWIEFYH
jgi:biotin operon repressor